MIRVGQVVGAFGLEGAVKVSSLTDFPERFAPASELFLDGLTRRVEWSRQQPTGLVVKLSGIDSRSVAQAQRGRYLEVPDSDLRQLPEGRWYHHQLVGMAVTTERGRHLGTLVDVVSRPANDVWVARAGGVEHLIPATQNAVLDVNLEAARITVADWLVEVEDA
ncbi:MAG TPA: ribosome maturation factor RimM [Candidatus Dormibacteraeota bacterium]|nr:ribosome maturation factor RimM [Candidatus Dormibacteraeota bacterium]